MMSAVRLVEIGSSKPVLKDEPTQRKNAIPKVARDQRRVNPVDGDDVDDEPFIEDCFPTSG